MLEDGVRRDIERQLGVGLGLGQQHRGDALELVGRAGREGLARLVDEAPVAFLGGLRGQRDAVRPIGQRLEVGGRVVERGALAGYSGGGTMLGGAREPG